jgi:hypothetical protein
MNQFKSFFLKITKAIDIAFMLQLEAANVQVAEKLCPETTCCMLWFDPVGYWLM